MSDDAALVTVGEELVGEGSAVDDLVSAIEALGEREEIEVSAVLSEVDVAPEMVVAVLDTSGNIDPALFIRFPIVLAAATITWSMTVFGKAVVG